MDLRIKELINALDLMKTRRYRSAIQGDWRDMERLYSSIRRTRPHVCVELGSGYSTCAIGVALKHNNFGCLWSLDAQEKWAGDVATSLATDLHRFVITKYSPIEWTQYYGVEGWHYTLAPPMNPDFIYCDGPELTEGNALKEPTLTPLKYALEFRNPNLHIYVDGRVATVDLLYNQFGHLFDVHPLGSNRYPLFDPSGRPSTEELFTEFRVKA